MVCFSKVSSLKSKMEKEEVTTEKRIGQLDCLLKNLMDIVEEQHSILKIVVHKHAHQRGEEIKHAIIEELATEIYPTVLKPDEVSTNKIDILNVEAMSKRIDELSSEVEVLKKRLLEPLSTNKSPPINEEKRAECDDEIQLKAKVGSNSTGEASEQQHESSPAKPCDFTIDKSDSTVSSIYQQVKSHFDSIVNTLLNIDIENNKNALLISYSVLVMLIALFHTNGLKDDLIIVYCVFGWKLKVYDAPISAISIVAKAVFGFALMYKIYFDYNKWATSMRASMEIEQWTWQDGVLSAFYPLVFMIGWKNMIRFEPWIGYNDTPLVLYLASSILFNESGFFFFFQIVMVYSGWIIGVWKPKFNLVSIVAKLMFLMALYCICLQAHIVYLYGKLGLLQACNWFLVLLTQYLEALQSAPN